jgi:hypothetical protein
MAFSSGSPFVHHNVVLILVIEGLIDEIQVRGDEHSDARCPGPTDDTFFGFGCFSGCPVVIRVRQQILHDFPRNVGFSRTGHELDVSTLGQ